MNPFISNTFFHLVKIIKYQTIHGIITTKTMCCRMIQRILNSRHRSIDTNTAKRIMVAPKYKKLRSSRVLSSKKMKKAPILKKPIQIAFNINIIII